MPDRFNFRFWDTEEKVMIEWDCVCQSAFNCTREEGNKLERYGLMYWAFTTPSRFIPLQCTGLKDKNGKFIFEGDIVRVDGNLFEIVYEIGSFMIATKTNCASIHQFKGYWNDNVYPLSQLYFEYKNEEFAINNLEIIGNIYENPELLEEVQ